MMKITALYNYPIKGLRAIKLETAPIGPHGIRYDRTFMLFHHDPATSTTQKLQLSSHPQCGLFSQTISGLVPDDPSQGNLIVHYHTPKVPLLPHEPEHDSPLEIPLVPEYRDLEKFTVDLYGSKATGYRVGGEADRWFSKCFGMPVVLIYIGDGRRPILGTSAPSTRARLASVKPESFVSRIWPRSPRHDTLPPDDWITWSDMAPFLITSDKSLQAVQERVSSPIRMRRFRPNIVVDGGGYEAWDEDFWTEVTVADGLATFALTANCARCTSLNVDYRTGRVGEGDLGKVLRKLMSDRRVDVGNKWSPVFGRYAYLVGSEEEKGFGGEVGVVQIEVGDEVMVTGRKTERDVWDWPTANQRAEQEKKSEC